MIYAFSVVPLMLLTGLSQADKSDTLNNQFRCKMPDSTPTTTESNSDIKRHISKLNITTSSIFDESAEDSLAMYSLANWMHINTKEHVIKERLPFKVEDSLDEDVLL
ncbi:MAG: hypothetical protein ACI936_001917 [Paraglaciecola sp.]|jgi:hypothetical protein